MIFFVAMPFVTGLMNYVVPLQIGARDVSFPFLNNFSFWMTTAGAIIIMLSLFVGEFARTGWLAYPPLSGADYSPGVGVDYYIWGLQVAGIGTTLSGINLIATIVKMRAPGMTFMKMPIFTWTSLCTNVLIVATFPILTATLALLSLDRYAGTNFFTNDLGGNPMMYINLIWIWGHPEVYILVLPAFGIFSEVVATFCGKRLFGYASMVYATCVIMILSYIVWLHHFFTMGVGRERQRLLRHHHDDHLDPDRREDVQLALHHVSRPHPLRGADVWTIGFMVTFVIGGMTGVMLAVPPADFVLHNSLFLIAHFHNVIIGGVVFGLMAGVVYWWPKAFGYKLDQVLGPHQLLVLADRLLRRLHAALRARPDGRHPPRQSVRGSFPADMVRHRRHRCRDHCLRHRSLHHPARRLIHAPRPAARDLWRSVGRAHAGMVDFLAAAGLQLRLHARRA
jgi:cytochrome o ubiquinol oxidase subunit 1